MTALPVPLRHWADFLGHLEPELVDAIGPWLPRLAASLEGWRPRLAGGGGDPDGFGGLARRGAFERLVPSQWALADEAGDEFLRRAAQSELLFFEPVRRARAGARRLVALLDAGPDQVGAPRLAQLGCLVVLWRRAVALGADCRWGFVQRPGSLHGDIRPGTLQRHLLAGGRELGFSPREEHLAAWHAALSRPERAGLWLLGGAVLGALPGAEEAARVEVVEPRDLGRRELDLAVRPRGAATQRLTLPLPSPDATVRLLRDPFHLAAQPPARLELGLGRRPTLLFSPNARRLLVEQAGGEFCALAVPGSPRGRPGRAQPIPHERGARLLSVGWHWRRPLAVFDHDGVLVVYGLPGTPRFEVAAPEGLLASPTSGDMPPGPCFGYGGRRDGGFAFLRGSNLWRVDPGRHPVVERIAPDVVCAAWCGGSVVVLEQVTQRTCSYWHHPLPVGGRRFIYMKAIYGAGAAHLGWPAGSPTPRAGLLAHTPPQGDQSDAERQTWSVLGGDDGPPIQLHADAEVIGVVSTRNGADERAAGLIVVEADRLGIRFVGTRMNRHVIRTREPIVSATAAAREATVACVTAGGSLTVFSLDFRGPLLRLETGSQP